MRGETQEKCDQFMTLLLRLIISASCLFCPWQYFCTQYFVVWSPYYQLLLAFSIFLSIKHTSMLRPFKQTIFCHYISSSPSSSAGITCGVPQGLFLGPIILSLNFHLVISSVDIISLSTGIQTILGCRMIHTVFDHYSQLRQQFNHTESGSTIKLIPLWFCISHL